MDQVPIWEKSNLTIKEAAEYSGIGESKLRLLTHEDDCPFVLWIGRKCLVDQDVMNKFSVPDKVVKLPTRFNEAGCTGETNSPAVVHYAGIPNWYNNQYIHRHEYLDGVIKECGLSM